MGIKGVERHYVADDSIAVGVEWEGVSGNQSLSAKEVRCEDMQNPTLCGHSGTKKNSAQEL